MKIQHGVKSRLPDVILASQIDDDKSSGKLKLALNGAYSFDELETYLPVYHKSRILAILFLKRKNSDLDLDLDFTQALSNILVVALENKRFARKQVEQEVLNREVAIASKVQQMLFPATLPNTEKIKAKVTYFPHSLVGGDYYDLILKSEEEIYFCIADVSGKGVSAALLMSNFQATLRTLLRSNADMKTIINQLNFTLFENTKGERFITFFLGCYNPKRKSLTYINAGHNAPLLCWDKDDFCEELHAGTTILGAFEKLPFLEIGSRENLSDFSIHLYTDGVTEAMNEKEEEYGDERFFTFVNNRSKVVPEEFHQLFLDEIKGFTGDVPLRDDLTLLSLRFD